MVTHLQLKKKQPNLTQSFPRKNNKCKLFSQNKQASLEVTGKRFYSMQVANAVTEAKSGHFSQGLWAPHRQWDLHLLRGTQKLPYGMKPQEILWV